MEAAGAGGWGRGGPLGCSCIAAGTARALPVQGPVTVRGSLHSAVPTGAVREALPQVWEWGSSTAGLDGGEERGGEAGSGSAGSRRRARAAPETLAPHRGGAGCCCPRLQPLQPRPPAGPTGTAAVCPFVPWDRAAAGQCGWTPATWLSEGHPRRASPAPGDTGAARAAAPALPVPPRHPPGLPQGCCHQPETGLIWYLFYY